jgi:MFS superfamily sulfate permease-like transporter
MSDENVAEAVGWKKYVPIANWLPTYQAKWLRVDVLAAITVWALLVPEAMAYAEIAGVPPEAGLYAAPLALLGYAIFGTSRQLNVGPSSTVAIISAAVVAPLAGGDTELYIALTAALAIVTGVLCIVLGLIRGGALANFLSDPVLKGFLVGLAIVVATGQLNKILGYEVEGGGVLYELLQYVVNIAETHWPTLAVGLVSLVLLFAIERWLPKVPGALTVVVLSIVAVSVFNLDEYGVHIVGEIPAGLPPFGFPDVTLQQLGALVPGGAAVLIVAFAESLAAAKQYANKHGYKVDPNQELIGIGAANVGAGLSQGFVVDGSLSKSAALPAASHTRA